MKLSIVIPVYNEVKTLEELLKRVLAVDLGKLEREIILVDDASSDGSADLIKELAEKHQGIKTHYHKENQGKGASLRDGFRETTGDYVIVQDADLEYDPNEYLKLLRELEEDKVDVVYGSRFSGNYEDMTNLHYFGNKSLTMLTNLLYGVLLTDMETCYKLLPGKFVREIEIESDRFDFEPEITAKILKSGMRIKEVPITYKGRSFSEGKKITWKDGLIAFWTLIKYRFN
ncbi:glycosyltransferase family 2 protein [candidate division WWE3 bacterium]|jgi:glycosyltransferase involved in cell wall biosynthesis|nr:glycosyltransferase family 2 protein [candidate division WWE3 bacterium]MBT7349564.1 glycosyltransferase family 2 protein [candidate division WWE3 bacterium]